MSTRRRGREEGREEAKTKQTSWKKCQVVYACAAGDNNARPRTIWHMKLINAYCIKRYTRQNIEIQKMAVWYLKVTQ
jgi:hypothetical protein